MFGELRGYEPPAERRARQGGGPMSHFAQSDESPGTPMRHTCAKHGDYTAPPFVPCPTCVELKDCTCAFHPEMTTWHLPSCPMAKADERDEKATASRENEGHFERARNLAGQRDRHRLALQRLVDAVGARRGGRTLPGAMALEWTEDDFDELLSAMAVAEDVLRALDPNGADRG